MPNSWPHASGLLAGLMAGLRCGCPPGPAGAAVPHALEGETFSLSGGYDTMRAVVGRPDRRHARHDGLGEIRLVGGLFLL
tara:strand:- start:197 stop:436 length:240 start_codon:yes stop_codon:yes gene_type:complete